ncbi:MAG: hypothetical protein ISR48_00030 [Alphaproteobacteria bacterium]|nr:hypothetical protein [Alphaproteobacteria bacterium]
MPKTDVKKPESEDLSELGDEALDRTTGTTQACFACGGGPCYSPAE